MQISTRNIRKAVIGLANEPMLIHQPLNIERVGYIHNKTELIERTFALPSIIFVFKGNGFLKQNESQVALEAPFLMWNLPGEHKSYWPVPVWEEYYIGFEYGSETMLKKVLAKEFFTPLLRPMQNPDACRKIAEDIRLTMEMPRLPGMADRLYQQSMLLLTEAVFTQHSGMMSYHGNILNQITEYMICHFKESIDLKATAAKFGWSYSTFQRQWRQRNHCGANHYLRQLRNYEAHRILSETDWSIGETADYLGFKSQFYFSPIFTVLN